MENRKLKTNIARYINKIFAIMMIFIFVTFAIIQVVNAIRQEREEASYMFFQIEQIFEKNKEELVEVENEYASSCLTKAKAVSYILQHNPEMVDNNDVSELLKVASLVQVDEIHVFTDEGNLFYGTSPQFYGYTFDSGEQMNYFKDMLEDKDLELVQDITPNTAEGKMVQYSAVWSENKEIIVEVGMYPEKVLKAMEKNELEYIFSLLRANSGVTLLAVDKDTNLILGCTDSSYIDLNISDIGLADGIHISEDGIITDVDGEKCLVVFTEINDTYVGYITPMYHVFSDFPMLFFAFVLGLIIMALILVYSVTYYVENVVIKNIYFLNDDLRRITDGDLDIKVNVKGSKELVEMSSHINDMVSSLLSANKKLTNAMAQIEEERDRDTLTKLYNRRGLDNHMARLEQNPVLLKYCAIVMADADGLKEINDNFGHEAGDRYLIAVGEIFEKFLGINCIGARQGGDEFVLFLWGFDSEEVLLNQLEVLKSYQNGLFTQVSDEITTEIRFSMGYATDENHLDYQELLKKADKKMYINKLERKAER
ncbi:MAG: GGDEF domain-containing protein [Lachnospiraceae bacterium]|nr:GGDEF domain-containing protein [Lachnospiraceae bacterium]